ncbi:glycerophosphodiester phosphodiesterase [Pseudonocardia sp. TMWB2A]|uniref:glycerophosphodiester phosphodiesterase family protein n=1 Tax=Pseudonocardia sp. TMWB2A TaxID=687430 RepID=UPI00307E25DD
MPLLLSALLDNWRAPPPDETRRLRFLTVQPFAHRGLHGGRVIENSRAAFRAGMAQGHGIECDVQVSKDGTAYVFHDYDLDRLTDASGKVADKHDAELDAIRLKGTDETIPRLTEMLALVAGKVPLLIEIKSEGRRVHALCLSVRRGLEGYAGPAAVMSFNPYVASWFNHNGAHIIRGLVVTEEGKQGLRGRAERHLSLWKARPDFLAYDIRDLPSEFAESQRVRGLPLLTWTVRTADQEAVAFNAADEVIYERVAH